ncbi:hypothetical protein AB0K02_33955 [Streptomyces sp. NPDC049597]|uniref:hypothetical protein n=1 Tax=Streptomyces sp. NPDC049597 TaxID=3155276 RepID=UPI003425DFA2
MARDYRVKIRGEDRDFRFSVSEESGYGTMLFGLFAFAFPAAALMLPGLVWAVPIKKSADMADTLADTARITGLSYGAALVLDLIAARGGGFVWWSKLARPAVLTGLSFLVGLLVYRFVGPHFLGSDESNWLDAHMIAVYLLTAFWYLGVRVVAEDA